MPRILIVGHTDLKKDPRPYRQIETLKSEGYEVSTIGSGPSGIEDSFYKLRKLHFAVELLRLILLKLGLYTVFNMDRHKRKMANDQQGKEYDLAVVHEVRMLPMVSRFLSMDRIILDAHEYSPKNFDDSLLWRVFIKRYYTWLCEKYIPLVNHITTVSNGIVDEYRRVFDAEVSLVKNSSKYVELQPTEVNPSNIKLIHHGIASPSRDLELLVDTVKLLDERYTLDFLLTHTKAMTGYVNKLKSRASDCERIRFLEPIPRQELIPFANGYDIGIHFVPPKNFNIKYGLGNKFFEFIQSRLAVAIGPDIEMTKFTAEYGFGIRCDEWTAESMAKAIAKYSHDEIAEKKQNAHKASVPLSNEEDMKMFMKIVEASL